jgi:hypothetical protein
MRKKYLGPKRQLRHLGQCCSREGSFPVVALAGIGVGMGVVVEVQVVSGRGGREGGGTIHRRRWKRKERHVKMWEPGWYCTWSWSVGYSLHICHVTNCMRAGRDNLTLPQCIDGNKMKFSLLWYEILSERFPAKKIFKAWNINNQFNL